jgi:hypothetical protein
VWKFWVSGVCTVVTGGLGTAGNILSLIVLCKRYNSDQAEARRLRKKRKEARKGSVQKDIEWGSEKMVPTKWLRRKKGLEK